MNPRASSWWTRAALPATLALVVVFAFLPALGNGFVHWDDDYALTGNMAYRGLGWAQLRWMFTTTLLANYVPLAWMTLGLDYLLWGMNPAGYHLTNLLLHATGTILFYVLARRLIGAGSRLTGTDLDLAAATAALFFAIHPLRVESVAWASERRDVLSVIFYVLTILLYVRAAAEAPRRRRLLAASVTVYALAVLSKPTVVPLPAVLVILDFYPLRRVPQSPRTWFGREARGLWVEKLPYLGLALAGALASYLIHAQHGVVAILDTAPATARVLYSLWFYASRTLVPRGLSPMHELPERVALLAPPFLVAGAGVLAITALVLLMRRAWPAGLAAWAYYAVVLAPVAGAAQAGAQIAADRYSYLPSLGWALLAGGAMGALIRAARTASQRAWAWRILVGAGGLWLVILWGQTWHLTRTWRSTETLWERALEVDPGCAFCHDALGVWLMHEGRPLAAAARFERAVALRPAWWMRHGHLAQAYAALGRQPEAIVEYRRELALYPRSLEARDGLANALIRSGRPADALDELEPALAWGPEYPPARTTLAVALTRLGRPREAVTQLLTAIALSPGDGLPRLLLVQTYLDLGEAALAREQYTALQRIDPARARTLGERFGDGSG